MGSARVRVGLALVGALGVALLGGCAGDSRADQPPSAAPLALLTADQLDAALLTQRSVGATYDRSDGARLAGLGCLDALDPALLGAGVDAPTASARAAWTASASELGVAEQTSVTSVVVSLGSERAAAAAMDDFSVAVADCTSVRVDDGATSAELDVTSRLVPTTAPVRQEVLVTAEGHRTDGVASPAVGVSVKVGWTAHHLVAVETTGTGAYAPDITPYFNAARARLLAVVAGQDPGPGRPVNPTD